MALGGGPTWVAVVGDLECHAGRQIQQRAIELRRDLVLKTPAIPYESAKRSESDTKWGNAWGTAG